MTENNTEETVATQATEVETKETQTAPSQPTRTEKEKAEFTLKKNADRLRELGGDPSEVLGVRTNISVSDELPDDKPLTVKDLRDIQERQVKQTALQLADDIEDEDEREETKKLLGRLKPSSDPHADLAIAQAAANTTRTAQIAKDIERRTKPTRTAAGGSAPVRQEAEFTPTAEETVFMKPPFNVSKEKILALRQKQKDSQ